MHQYKSTDTASWKTEGDNWVKKDKNGSTISKHPRQKLPDGSYAEPLGFYKGTLLKDYPSESLKSGDEISICENPGGKVYLTNLNTQQVFETDAVQGKEFAYKTPVEKISDGFNDLEIFENVDLIQEMIDADPPPDMDFDQTKIVTFLNDKETHTKNGYVVLYDTSLYAKPFDPEELLYLVHDKKIPGIIVEDKVVLDLIKIALDSFMQARSKPTQEDKNDLARRIHEVLEPLNLL